MNGPPGERTPPSPQSIRQCKATTKVAAGETALVGAGDGLLEEPDTVGFAGKPPTLFPLDVAGRRNEHLGLVGEHAVPGGVAHGENASKKFSQRPLSLRKRYDSTCPTHSTACRFRVRPTQWLSVFTRGERARVVCQISSKFSSSASALAYRVQEIVSKPG